MPLPLAVAGPGHHLRAVVPGAGRACGAGSGEHADGARVRHALCHIRVLTLCQRVGADPLVPPVCRQLPGAGPETGGKAWDPMGISDMCPYGSTQYEWMRTAEVGAAAAL